MNLPHSVRIGPITYEIVRDGEADANHRYGETNHLKREIRLGLICDAKHASITLLHELLHAIAEAYGFELEEAQVKPLALGLCQVLQDLKCWPEEVVLDA